MLYGSPWVSTYSHCHHQIITQQHTFFFNMYPLAMKRVPGAFPKFLRLSRFKAAGF